jgi:hypothetical protein
MPYGSMFTARHLQILRCVVDTRLRCREVVDSVDNKGHFAAPVGLLEQEDQCAHAYGDAEE